MNEDQNRVRFIRKNGRIIPIRERAKESAAIAVGAVAIDRAGLKISDYGDSRLSKEPNVDLKEFKSKYSSFIKKSGSPVISKGFKFNSAFMSHPKESGLRLIRPIVAVSDDVSEDVILHEIGHVRSSRRKFSMNRLNRSLHVGMKRNKNKKVLPSLLALISRKAQPITSAASELEATAEATRASIKVNGMRRGLKTLKNLSPFYAGYALRAGAVTLGGLAVINLFRGRNKK